MTEIRMNFARLTENRQSKKVKKIINHRRRENIYIYVFSKYTSNQNALDITEGEKIQLKRKRTHENSPE